MGKCELHSGLIRTVSEEARMGMRLAACAFKTLNHSAPITNRG